MASRWRSGLAGIPAFGYFRRLLQAEIIQCRLEEVSERVDIGRSDKDLLAVLDATESVKPGTLDNNAPVPGQYLDGARTLEMPDLASEVTPLACDQVGVRARGAKFTGTRWFVVVHFLSSRSINDPAPAALIGTDRSSCLVNRRHSG